MNELRIGINLNVWLIQIYSGRKNRVLHRATLPGKGRTEMKELQKYITNSLERLWEGLLDVNNNTFKTTLSYYQRPQIG